MMEMIKPKSDRESICDLTVRDICWV